MDSRILDFIAEHHVLTLATQDQGLLHCCNLFYAYDPQIEGFVVTSALKTLHAQQLCQHATVAASIVLESSTVGKIQGLQLRGTMTQPSESERAAARRVYLKRFPFAVVMDLELWILRPTYCKLTDNRLGFGKKILWEAQTPPPLDPKTDATR
ncbi:MAG: pyridoxamine 5'-phosphate oxidase family protein [Alistipes sp.]|nr:pyridoxamine 5'-phosphate oxidase family protein [Alistipes sp.]